MDFEAYDSIFEKACAEENDRVLVHMAMDRLMTPIGLKEKNRLRYEKYLVSVPEKIFEICLKNRKLEWLKFSVNSVLAGDKIETEVKRKSIGNLCAAGLDRRSGGSFGSRQEKRRRQKGAL